MRMIVCAFNTFTLKNEVVLFDDIAGNTTIGEFEFDEVSDAIYAACIKYGVNKVQLFGAEEFLNVIADGIQTKKAENYNNNFIEITIN